MLILVRKRTKYIMLDQIINDNSWAPNNTVMGGNCLAAIVDAGSNHLADGNNRIHCNKNVGLQDTKSVGYCKYDFAYFLKDFHSCSIGPGSHFVSTCSFGASNNCCTWML